MLATLFADLSAFVLAVFSYILVLVAGGVIVGLMSFIKSWTGIEFPRRAYTAVFVLSVFIAFFLAWRDEHIKSIHLESALQEARAERVLQVVQRPEPRIEKIFNQSNWDELEFTGRDDRWFDIRLTLDHEPEESSLDIHRGSLWVNRANMQIAGKTVTFITVSDKFEYAGADAIVVRYYPKK